ncbi:uncharacterized protein LOC143056672 isoform X1 [Mytilus galloprovincialis]|uniref:uncharacterized protein LOC143056672 isoform X1 n=1 Tax=Mytilus galloprovincialis TaxID=29158 RepID=UPI003F7BA22D
MSKKFGGKKKGGKAFGKFGNVDLSNTNSSENVLSFGKALKSVKNIENDYTAANTSNQGKLVKKISSVSLEKTLKTLEKTVFKWKSLSTNYIAFVEDLYNKLKDVKENEPVRLNWTGLEHLTDAVFGCLLEKNDVPGYKFVIGIVLTGCNQLTDVGIKWMSQCFPKLKEVSLAGCIKVTETGVYNLLENCWDLKSVDLTATGVMILPSQIVGKEVDTAGCPLVSPSEGFVQQYGGLDKMKEPSFKKPDNKNLIKVCVIRPENSTSSMMPLFSSETSNLPVSFKEGFKFDKTDITANIIEFEEGMIDRFVSKRSVVMVTYEPEEKKSVDDIVSWLFSVYCQVLSKVSRACVLFVAMVKDDKTKVDQHLAAFKIMLKTAKDKLIQQKKKLLEQKPTEKSPITRIDQSNFTYTKELIEMMETQDTNVTFLTSVKGQNITKVVEGQNRTPNTGRSQKEMEELLAKVVPVVDAARSGLEDISKGGIAELKALNNPPKAVSDVCACLLILKSKKDTSWNAAKIMMGDSYFLKSLLEFDVSTISQQQFNAVNTILSDKSQNLTVENVKKMSVTAAAFLKFVLAMMEYWVVMKEMKTPKKGYHQLTREIKRDKLSNNLLEEILSAAERTFTLYPEFEEISSHLYQYICSETSMNMFKGDDNTPSGILSLEGAALTTARTMECLHMFGKLLYVYQDDSHIVMDVKWMFKLLSTATMNQANTGMLPHVSETTNVVLIDDMEKKSTELKIGEKNSFAMLTKLGLGMSHRIAYVPYRNLENEPPVSMDEYLGKDSQVQEIKYQFNLVHSLCTDIMNKIFTCTSNIRRPTILWKNGIVILENLSQIAIQLKNSKENPHIEVVVQTSNSQAGDLKTVLPKILLHPAKKIKLIVEYVLTNSGIPFKVEAKEKLKTVPEGICGFIDGHRMSTNDSGAVLCQKCGMSSRHNEFMMEMKKKMLISDSVHQVDTPEKEKITGESVIDSDIVFKGVESGQKYPFIVVQPNLHPIYQPDISFTPLDLDKVEDVVIELRTTVQKGTVLSYSFKTGQVKNPQDSKVQQVYKKDPLGKTVNFAMSPWPTTEKGDMFSKLKLTINGEAQIELKLPTKLYVPVLVYHGVKSADMKSVIMVHGHTQTNGQSTEVKPGMRLEALDRKTPNFWCVATVQTINPDDSFVIHFDGWTSGYDYVCTPDSTDIHPLGWLYATTHKLGTPSGKTIRLQEPKQYGKAFDWPIYCEEVGCLPVPYDFFSDEQKGETTSDETQRVYDHLGISMVGSSKDTSICSVENIPGYFIENQMMQLRDQSSDELISFYSNHRQFLCLLPEKFDLKNLRFPSLTSVMDIEKQNVHFICPGHKMELLHMVDHAGLPLHHYLISSSEVDINSLYAYLEMIYMGLILQPSLLPSELVNICPGVDISTEDKTNKSLKLELLEMGFKRIFFHYFLWINTYNHYLVVGSNKRSRKIDRSTTLPAKILKDEKSVKSLSSKFNITGTSNVIKCEGHSQSSISHADLHDFDSSAFKNYAKFMHKFEFQDNAIEALPDNFFMMFKNLNELNLSQNKLSSLPEGFSCLTGLESLDVSSNNLSKLPNDFSSVKETLENLNISFNPLGGIPAEVYSLTNLQVLEANNLGKLNLKGIGKLTSLEKFYAASNIVEEVPQEMCSLPLTHLDLSGIPWFPDFLEQKIQPNKSTFITALNNITVFKMMTEEEKKALFVEVDKDANGILDKDEITLVNKIIFEMYPRFGRKGQFYPDHKKQQNSLESEPPETAVPPVIWKLKSLQSLSLRYHAFTLVPDHVKELLQLESLDISHNPDIEKLSGELGGLPLRELHLNGCPSLRTPPKEIVSRGFSVVYGYLRRLQQGSVECKRTKLMVVGLGGAGKTSLIRALTNPGYSSYHDYGEKITDGIDITNWNVPVPNSKSNITYSVWDFAGQTVYYNTHQFFLSNRACYLLLWNIRLGFEHAGLDFWLNSIACHAPKAPILVVGTHCDKVEKSRIPQKELMATYPQIAGFYFVSSYSGEGISNLHKSLVDVTLQQKYMGESIPEAWLSLEKLVMKQRENKLDLIPLSDVKTMSSKVGILDEAELIQAVQFLHDLGSLQFFNTEFLRSLVVIVPQWIVDVMACVVTVHVGPIQEGKLLHKDMKVVWQSYPKELHPWLLRLTEEFDLTFPLSDEEANLVPCLLPDTVVEVPWPAIEEDSDIRETKAIYNFKYLPAGLFNRAQVRLHQFAESGQLWKKGMFLKKNDHIAVIRQKGQTILEVKAQGYRPENILFLVDEVISTLIAESYSGVYYDLMIPCIECQNLGMVDPSMFPSSKVHRAVELNAPFLQCDKMFHVLSIPELKSLMPPNKTTEFDEHLRRSVFELKDLGEDVNISVIFCYSKKNVPDLAQENKLVHPGNIVEDLRKDGFNVTICDNPETADVESLTIAFKSAQVILFGASDEFCADETCKKLLIFAKETLNKPILLVVLGSSLKFLETSIGLNIADEVFVKMTDVGRYEPKIKELKAALKKKKGKGALDDNPQCFISYCWANSKDAIAKGTAKLEGAIGFGDPRELATKLQAQKIPCWLDIQRVGNSGLFDDIADGLRKAKVMVACVSDEYANSKNCKMEFRFAVAKLKIPTVLAVVGTGYNWERSEIGMLAVGSKCLKINFQMLNEAGYLQLFQEIQKYVKVEEEKSSEADVERKKHAFGEILESAERQFLRHLIKFREKSFTADYPRLVIINLVDKEKRHKEEEERKKKEEEERKKGEEEQKKQENGENLKTEQEEEDIDDNSKVKSREANYCFSLMCENEEGWHDVPETIPFPEFTDGEEEETYLSMAAPYAARINSILKYSGQQMAVIATPAGKQLQEKLLSHASAVTSEDEVEKAYNNIIKDVTEKDEEQTYGGLKKTSLLNGKTLWLCGKHREKVGSITEQRYKTQLKPTQLEEDKPQREKTVVEAVSNTPTQAAAGQPKPSGASSSQKTPEQPKSRVFNARNSKSPGTIKRQTSQACNVM